MRTLLLVLTLFVCPSVVSAQTVGDVVRLATAIATEKEKCAKDDPFCQLPFAMLGQKAITLSADAQLPYNDACIAKMTKDLQDSSCAEIALQRWQTIQLKDGHLAAYHSLKRAFEDAAAKRKRNNK